METNKLHTLKEMIDSSSNIVVLTGAGISTESGIPDFASSKGLKTDHGYIPTETVLSHNFFFEHPEQFYEFYNQNLINKNALPNKAHKYLAKLEQEGKLKAIITQNIDDLHQMAGSKNVITLHGTTKNYTCPKCHKKYTLEEVTTTEVPHCDECNAILKPDVILYSEQLDTTKISKAINYIKNADMLIVIGTALRVYPAAGLVEYYNKQNHKLVEINLSSSNYNEFADLEINEKVGAVFTQLEKLY